MPLQRSRRTGDLATFERAVNAAGLVLWSCDARGRCTYMSEYWTELTGHPLQPVIGDGWQQFMNPEDLPRVMPEFEVVLRQRQPLTIEYRLRRKDGTEFWVRDHGTPVFERRVFRGYVGTILEIDERKQLEESLRAANELFSLAARGTNDGIWDWNLVTNEGRHSERSLEILGHPLERIATFKQFLCFVHPRDRARVMASIQQHLADRKPHAVEYRWRTPEGRYRWMHSRGQAVWDASGRPVRMAGSTGDITARKRAELRVETLNRRLTESNAALQHQSEALKDLAQQLMEVSEQERSRVARELHDDLSQNLAYLQMRLAVLAQSTPSQQGPLTELEKLAEQLVDDVRRVARDLHSTVLDHLGLERALRSYCADFASSTKLAIHVRRKGRIQEPPAPIGLCFYRVAQEAIRNAARHSGAHTITVTLQGAPGSLTLRVEDKGSGFEPASAGTGLGLNSMAERVRLAGGQFRLVTRPSRGTFVEAVITWPT